MKTSELTGALLDSWVARIDPQCEGCIVEFVPEHIHGPHYVGAHEGSIVFFIPVQTNFRQALLLKREYRFAEKYQPTVDWSQAGPIIQRVGIDLQVSMFKSEACKTPTEWCAKIEPGIADEMEDAPRWIFQEDASPLVAAMRAYVQLKFGDEVPDSHEASIASTK